MQMLYVNTMRIQERPKLLQEEKKNLHGAVRIYIHLEEWLRFTQYKID